MRASREPNDVPEQVDRYVVKQKPRLPATGLRRLSAEANPIGSSLQQVGGIQVFSAIARPDPRVVAHDSLEYHAPLQERCILAESQAWFAQPAGTIGLH